MSQADQRADRPLRVLVVLAHPDDPEFFCGGTVGRWAAEGREIHYCLLTRGDKGADEPGVDPAALAETREREQRAAAAVLGVTNVEFLDYEDGNLVADLETRKAVVRVIRTIRPDIVITCDPTNVYGQFVNHVDHRVAGQVTLDAVYPAARSALYFPDLYEGEGLEPHKVHELYIAGPVHPNTSIDVTAFMDLKLKALTEHRSQIDDFESLTERLRKRMLDPDSPTDAVRYIERFAYIGIR
jgi:LmbE family N-acetylglucosaminyl deacetylase